MTILVVNEDNDLPETPTLTDNKYLGVESGPGYGEITKKIGSGDVVANTAMKKVFKCPHCSFWDSTASRFHVHIVRHLKKKPFECSLCAHRSNWRWDIPQNNLASSLPLNISSMLLEHLSQDINFLKNLQNFNIVAHAFIAGNIIQQQQHLPSDEPQDKSRA
jgi:hypothetical protein